MTMRTSPVLDRFAASVLLVALTSHAAVGLPTAPEAAISAAGVLQPAESRASGPAAIAVTFAPGEAAAQPVSGRLVIALIAPGSKLPPGTSPHDAPFWDDLQPLFAKEVTGLKPGDTVVLDDTWEHNSIPVSKLAPGQYQAGARLIATRISSSWKSVAGNWTSPVTSFEIPPAAAAPAAATVPVKLELSQPTKARQWRQTDGVELFEMKSELLSAALGREVTLRAGVVLPAGYDPSAQIAGKPRQYAAVYEVPGFGGDHTGAAGVARGRKRAEDKAAAPDTASAPDPARLLAQSTFWIVLDPESNNGHALFADSANNGPRGKALTEELIPALERKYPLLARPEARLLRGHSSGGWSTLWLALNYPSTFGAAWPSAPDPVDFRRFQAVDIYTQKNMYIVPADDTAPEKAAAERIRATPGGAAEPAGGRSLIMSYRKAGKGTMSVRQETQGEDILGADNTSGQQWDSWFAVFGPRNSRGNPAALFDPVTGTIDRAVAEQYRTYDIGLKLRTDPAKYGPIFRKNIHLIVGDADEFFLNEAVALLKADLDALWPAEKTPGTGSITIIPGKTHGSVFGTPQAQRIPADMVEHLRATGVLPRP